VAGSEHSFFWFSKKERRALIFLMLLVGAVNLLTYLVRQNSIRNSKSKVNSFFLAPVPKNSSVRFERRPLTRSLKHADYTLTSSSFKRYRGRPFHFDPQEMSYEDWIDIGINPRAASNIQKYIQKGGRFYHPSDLKKIHGMDSAQAAFLANYLKVSNKGELTKKLAERQSQIVDINLADSANFESLKGIGPTLAGRIIRFREKLGGFINSEQLKEVYGFKDSLWGLVKINLNLKSFPVKRIPLNEADFNTLSNHPYIGYRHARSILAYRRQHGLIRDSADLLNIHGLDADQWKRMRSYVRF
jgi:competence protein ComEA